MPAASSPRQRALDEVHNDLAERRLALLIQQMNARAEVVACERELAVIERRLDMIWSVREARQ